MEQNEQVCLQIRNLSKQFTIYNTGKTIYACQHVSLTLNQGEFIGITGKSGSGKSTILKGITEQICLRLEKSGMPAKNMDGLIYVRQQNARFFICDAMRLAMSRSFYS